MVDGCHFKKYCHSTLCVVLNVRRELILPCDGGVGRERAICTLPPPQAECSSGKFCKDYKQNSYHASQARFFPGPARSRKTHPCPCARRTRVGPSSSSARGSRVPAEPPQPDGAGVTGTSSARKVRAAAGQPRGGVRATSPASPGGPRPPTGRRPSADRSEGFRSRSRRRPRERLSPASPAPRPRGPRRSSGPGHEPGGPPGFRPPGQRPQNPARPPQRTGKAREPTARRPAGSSSFQPRPPPASHRPPPNPSRLRQAAPARARSSPATRPGPQHTAPTGCVHRK